MGGQITMVAHDTTLLLEEMVTLQICYYVISLNRQYFVAVIILPKIMKEQWPREIVVQVNRTCMSFDIIYCFYYTKRTEK